MSGTAPETRAEASVDALVAGLFDRIAELAQEAAGLWSGGPPAASDLATLRPAISRLVVDNASLISGAGVAGGPGSFADQDRWLEWWWARPDRGPEALRVNLDPRAPDCYDVAGEPWYQVPMREGRGYVAGPTVDYACTMDYALTMAWPIESPDDGRPVAVAALDVPVGRLETRLLPALTADAGRLTLVNGADRVVLSATAGCLPGDLVPGADPLRMCGHPALRGWRLIDQG